MKLYLCNFYSRTVCSEDWVIPKKGYTLYVRMLVYDFDLLKGHPTISDEGRRCMLYTGSLSFMYAAANVSMYYAISIVCTYSYLSEHLLISVKWVVEFVCENLCHGECDAVAHDGDDQGVHNQLGEEI